MVDIARTLARAQEFEQQIKSGFRRRRCECMHTRDCTHKTDASSTGRFERLVDVDGLVFIQVRLTRKKTVVGRFDSARYASWFFWLLLRSKQVFSLRGGGDLSPDLPLFHMLWS